MSYYLDDTIVAIASAAGGAARGIVRVAGPRAVDCLARCFQGSGDPELVSLKFPALVEGQFILAGLDRQLPCQLYIWPTSKSYTRTPLVEIHAIGSSPLLDAVVRALCAEGVRLAEPGEFTLRAFLSGRIDLAQAEAVLGVIDAGGEQQLAVALSQLAGGLSAPLAQLRDDLLELVARLEAGLDFVEEDIEFISSEELDAELVDAGGQIEQIAAQMSARGDSTALPRVVLVGSPNVGKSSLFNALVAEFGCDARRPSAALVADEPGTTRDYLAAKLRLHGVACELVDTAGLAEPNAVEDVTDIVRDATQEISRQQHQRADVQVVCLDATRDTTAEECQMLADGGVVKNRVTVLTKCDLPRRITILEPAVATSAATGLGIELLGAALAKAVAGAGDADSGYVSTTAARCRESLSAAVESLDRARGLAASSGQEELAAAELRAALLELGKVTGAVFTDDILDRIFSRFCIGK